MSPEELSVRLDLGVVDDLNHLGRLLRERRRENLAALRAPNPGFSEALYDALVKTRTAEVNICEEALRNLGEPLEDPEQLALEESA